MKHIVELICPGNDKGGTLAVGSIPINGNIVSMKVVRHSFHAGFQDAVYDIDLGSPQTEPFISIFVNDGERPVMDRLAKETDAPDDAFPAPVAIGQTVRFRRISSVQGGAGLRPTAILTIEDGLLNEGEIEVTTASLANLAEANITAPLGKSHILSGVKVDVAARVTVYRSPAYRTADAARPIGTLPEGDHGVIVDCNLIPGNLDLRLAPICYGATAEIPRSGDIAIRVQNRSGSTSPVEVTFTVNKLED